MTTREQLRHCMEEIDFAAGEVVTEVRPATVVFSFRAPTDWNDEILAEMTRRGLKNPNQLMKALIREGLDRAADEAAETVTVRVADLHRAIDSFVRTAA